MKNQKIVGLLGLPDHQAVGNLKGRKGAARGPEAFRRCFSRMSGWEETLKVVADTGDAGPFSSDIEENHKLAATRVAEIHQQFRRSIVVGGGHDHGYSHLLGIRDSFSQKSRLACINVDAHFDLRKPDPLISSGSPFYLAIENGIVAPERLIEFGIQRHCNSRSLWDYAREKKIETVLFDDLRNGKAVGRFAKVLKAVAAKSDSVVISFDLDAISEDHAPGVSAPQAEGFTSSEALQMVELASQEKKVLSLGLFELNPEHDIQDRTARLAALMAFRFLMFSGPTH